MCWKVPKVPLSFYNDITPPPPHPHPTPPPQDINIQHCDKRTLHATEMLCGAVAQWLAGSSHTRGLVPLYPWARYLTRIASLDSGV